MKVAMLELLSFSILSFCPIEDERYSSSSCRLAQRGSAFFSGSGLRATTIALDGFSTIRGTLLGVHSTIWNKVFGVCIGIPLLRETGIPVCPETQVRCTGEVLGHHTPAKKSHYGQCKKTCMTPSTDTPGIIVL